MDSSPLAPTSRSRDSAVEPASESVGRSRRLWRRLGLPVVTATLIPILLLAGLEVGLRLVGYGAPAAFFLPVEGRDGLLTSNPRFGWRVFPPALAREPIPLELAEDKSEATFRVVVLGGSAALGTPEPAFGFGRVFATFLRQSWPDTEFEVVVGAMAAVNSHVVRLVAEEAAEHEPDLFLIYLGNNEVVGPYGPGSVFGSSTPRLGLVRAALAARATRIGQLVQRTVEGSRRSLGGAEGAGPERWRGLEMFVDRPVTADDPRLQVVYDHLRSNLEDIVAAGIGAGADVALSTVAVNLLDSPPFGSGPPALEGDELAAWETAVQQGQEAWAAGRFDEAVAAFEAAVERDASHAELRYQLGRSLLTLGRVDEAVEHFRAARDLDTLRFRADGEVTRVIREVAAEASGPVHLVDAEAALGAVASAPGLPGDDLFYEHVHLRFAGNYLLAKAFFEGVRPALIARLGAPGGPGLPSPSQVAQRLGLTAADRLVMGETILAMTAGRPPFDGQLAADERTAAQRSELRRLRATVAEPAARQEILEIDRAALAAWPTDLALRQGWAETLMRHDRPEEAVEEWRSLVERLPEVVEWRHGLAFALADAGDLEAAEAVLRRALEVGPELPEIRVNLASILERSGSPESAETLYRQVLSDEGGPAEPAAAGPAARAARLNLARLLERRGDVAAAEAELRRAVEDHPRSAAAHHRLAEFLERRGATEAALDAYRESLRLAPDAAPVLNNLGSLLERTGRPAEAAARYRAAVEADPGYALGWFNLADLLLAYGQGADAVPAYERGLSVAPGNEQARRNLELARASVSPSTVN